MKDSSNKESLNHGKASHISSGRKGFENPSRIMLHFLADPLSNQVKKEATQSSEKKTTQKDNSINCFLFVCLFVFLSLGAKNCIISFLFWLILNKLTNGGIYGANCIIESVE